MADYKGLNIVWRADATDATKALHLISQEAKAAQGELTATSNGLKNLATNGRELNEALRTTQLEALGNQARLAAEKFKAYSDLLPQLKERLSDLQGQIEAKRVDIASAIASDDGTEEARLNISSLEGQLNSLEEQERSTSEAISRTHANMLEAQSSANELAERYRTLREVTEAAATSQYQWGERAKEWGETWRSIGDSISSVGDKMTIVSTAALMTFGRQTVSATEEFGNAIAQLGGYLDLSGAKLGEMQDLALEFGKETQFSATEAAQAMNELAKGGMSDLQIAGGAMEATMQLAAAGELDMASAAEVAVQAIKVFGVETDNASSVADALAGAANKSTAEVADLAAGFSQVGGAANMAGWDLNEVTGALALLADRGFSGSEAGTTLKTMLQRLASPTKKAAETMADLGIQVYDSSGQMIDAMDVIKRFEGALKGLTDQERNKALLDIFGQRGVNGITAMLDATSESFQTYIDATEQAGYASEMAKSRMGDLGWALEYMRGEVETATVNFGNALAPTIIGVAKAIEGATSAFNSLDEGAQRNIAQMALVVTATGPVLSVVGHLTSGIGGFASVLGTGAQTLATFAKSADENKTFVQNLARAYAEVTQPAEKVAAVTGSVERAMTSLATGGAIMLATALAGVVVSSITEGIDHMNDMREATEGLEDAMSGMASSIEAAYSQKLGESFAASSSEIRRSAEDLLASQIQLKDELEDTWSELGTDTAMLETYTATIEELSGKSSLTAEEQAKLESAVKGFNDIVGTSVSVVNSQTGELNTNADAIRGVTSAYADYARVQAIMEEYDKVQRQLIQNEMERKKYQDALKDGIGEMGLAQALLNGYTMEQIDAAQQASVAMEEAQRQQQSLKDTLDMLNDMLADSSITTQEYEDALSALGDAAGSAAGDFSDAGSEIEDAMEDAAEATEDAADRMVTALKRAQEDDYTIAKRGYEDKYAEKKAELDREYDLAKDGFDKEYDLAKAEIDRQMDEWEDAYKESYDLRKSELSKQYDLLADELDDEYDLLADQLSKQTDLLSKELSSQYDSRKKALDNETKALSDGLSKQLDARKKELSKEYDAIKSAMDKAVEAQRDALAKQLSYVKQLHSAEEDALKKSLDAQYKERQKELQKEYKERQKQNQRTLKEAKTAYKAETDAFKAETKNRIAEIKAEYEAKKKYLEETNGTKEIDEQIAAIEAESKAEADAKRRAEQEKRLAELQTAVDQAKTRRTRQDAEQALQDYLAELAEEARQAEREAQIQALEDRKDQIAEETRAKQEALDTERDQRIAAYEHQREDELAALQERQDAAYELLSEKLSEQLELYQEHNNQILEAYREELDAELQALSDKHAAEQEAISAATNAYIEQMRERNSMVLEGVKEAQNAETEMIREANAAQVESAKEAASAELEAIKEGNAAIIEQRKADDAAELEALKESNGKRLEEVKAGHDAELQSMADAHEREKEQREASNNATLEAIKANGAQQLSAIKESNDAILTQQKRDNEDALTELKRSQEDEMTNLKNALKEGKEEVVSTSRSAVTETLEWLDKLPEGWRERGEKSGDELSKALEGKRGAITTSAQTAVEGSKEQLDEHVKTWREAGGKGVDEHAKEIESKASNVEKATKTVTDKSGKVVEDSNKDITKKVETTAKTDVPKAIESGQSPTKTATEKVTKEVSNVLDKAVTDAKTSGQKLGTEYANGIQSSSSNVTNAVQSISSSVTSAFSSIEQGMYNSGQNAGIGFANGLNASAGQIYNTAQTIANNVAQTINSSLQIYSPSRVTKRSGRHTVEGMELGMLEEQPTLLKTAGMIAGSIGSALASGMELDAVRAEQERALDIYVREQRRALDVLGEQRARAEAMWGDGHSSPFDVEALDDSAAEYIDRYRVALDKIEHIAIQHYEKMGSIGGAYGLGGAHPINTVDLSGFATSVTTALTTAIGNMRVAGGVTVIVDRPSVRNDADIPRLASEIVRYIGREADMSMGRR